jgi:hypothetical protein
MLQAGAASFGLLISDGSNERTIKFPAQKATRALKKILHLHAGQKQPGGPIRPKMPGKLRRLLEIFRQGYAQVKIG